MDKVYNKLIRDKIPEIIEDAGEKPKIKTLNQKDFVKELKKKVVEEAHELQKAKNKKDVLNELVDIQELIDALRKVHKVSLNKLINTQQEKNKKRGSFRKRLYLIGTNIKK